MCVIREIFVRSAKTARDAEAAKVDGGNRRIRGEEGK